MTVLIAIGETRDWHTDLITH